MGRSDYLLSFLCGTATIAIIIPAQAVVALTAPEVNNIAEAVTVRIEYPRSPGDDPNAQSGGSGILIRREGNIYTVLTNWHVVEKRKNYQIYTTKETGIKVNSSKIQRIASLDLAVLQFNSSQEYPVAELGNSDQIKQSQTIYFAGYPKPSAVDPNRSYTFITAQVISRLAKPNREGYAFKYNGNSAQGMSGGPVLSEKGKVIGIHGKADVDVTTGSVGNYAIPMNLVLFLELSIILFQDK